MLLQAVNEFSLSVKCGKLRSPYLLICHMDLRNKTQSSGWDERTYYPILDIVYLRGIFNLISGCYDIERMHRNTVRTFLNELWFYKNKQTKNNNNNGKVIKEFGV